MEVVASGAAEATRSRIERDLPQRRAVGSAASARLGSGSAGGAVVGRGRMAD
ncbi:hypothetical protein OG470_19180 [Micromonospora sp. NBC_00389]|uniref:hypothetical protein n=1 Tax=Micromonospora sp. NBC_00389 TaxID=2903586 RepID=UPI002E1EBC2E